MKGPPIHSGPLGVSAAVAVLTLSIRRIAKKVIIECHIKRRAVGTFMLPGLLKIESVRKPATKARKPFTGQEITVAAEPASRAAKVQPLSGLKRMAE